MSTRTTAISIVALGLLIAVAAPLLPGGERLTPNDPPRTGHVTALTRAADGAVLAGTQDGELWRLEEGRWARVGMDLGRQPVMALDADLRAPPNRAPIGTAGGLVNPPPGLPPVAKRVLDLAPTPSGLVLATADGLLVQGPGTWQHRLPGTSAYRLARVTRDGADRLYAGTVGQGVYTAATADPTAWEADSAGLPEDIKVFAFAATPQGRLLAGTDRGLFGQGSPGGPWQPLETGLASRRVLALYLEPGEGEGAGAGGTGHAHRLWVGSDAGLYRVPLAETPEGLAALALAEPMPGTGALPYGVAAIVPAGRPAAGGGLGDGVLIAAGGVYRFGPSGIPGWPWLSLIGVGLVILGGWLFPGRETASTPPGERAQLVRTAPGDGGDLAGLK